MTNYTTPPKGAQTPKQLKTSKRKSRKRKFTVYQHKEEIANRDGGWYCHYCKKPIIPAGTLKDDPRYYKLETSVDEWGNVHSQHTPIGNYQSASAVDHKQPVSKGGSNELDNLVLTCWFCNSQKGDKTYDEYLAWLEKRGAE